MSALKGLLLGLALAWTLAGQDLGKLPDWARSAAAAAEPAPAGADAWVLLQRYEVAYLGGGDVRVRRLRLVRILGERGLIERGYGFFSLGGRASKVQKIKGWNLRPDGELVKVDTVVTIQNEADKVVGTGLERVMKGSLVAFEAVEVERHPMGPTWDLGLMERHPVRTWELAVTREEGWTTDLKNVAVRVETRHFAPWLPVPAPGQGFTVSAVPPLPRDEGARPHPDDTLPKVNVTFLDPALTGSPSLASWDPYAQWYFHQFAEKQAPSKVAPAAAPGPLAALQAIHRWMSREMTYKQLYLSPERGWIPDPGPEVLRKRYGDCKDLTCLFLSEAQGAGLRGCPVLARINEGHVEEEPLPRPIFNHVIAAIQLEASLGLGAEVATAQGRFLLVDPTDRTTPLGLLHLAHLGRRVLICTGQGAVWVTVPASAVFQPVARLTLEGSVNFAGGLTAVLRISETADAMGLRQAVLALGPARLDAFLREQWLSVPPTGRLVVKRQGDPLDQDHPFEVELELYHPQGFTRSGQEAALVAWGLPPVPAQILKAGRKRQYPVVQGAEPRWEFTATLKLPYRVEPVLGSLTGATAFRRFQWQATVREGTLRVAFSQDRPEASFPFERRDQGVAEWNRDRSAMKTLLEDGLAFSILP